MRSSITPLRRLLVLAAFGVLAFTSSTAVAQYASGEEAPAYNDYVARSFLIEVEPLVEKYTGWECEWPVPFQLVTRAQYADAIIADLRKDPSKQDLGVSDQELRAFLEAQAAGLLGLYSPTSKKLFFFPGNLKPSMRSLGLEHRFVRDLVEVIMAHELTHSVQDAQIKLSERQRKMFSKEEKDAWIMLVEGHASWVQERVAADLGLEESAQKFAEQLMKKHSRFIGSASESDDMGANMRGYIKGKLFVEAVYDKGGVKAVQRLFDNPPKSPRYIDDPDLYLGQVVKK